MRIVNFVAFGLLASAAACGGKTQPSTNGEKALPAANGLRSMEAFRDISDPVARSASIFEEIGKVLIHPRCSNCHPSDERPLQRDGLAHQPLVVRGADGLGAPAMHCSNCHGTSNFEMMPGAVNWHLAPLSMAWVGKSVPEICEQVKDPARNGGKTLSQIVEHVTEDAFVAYGWSPPEHLETAPGNQALFVQLVQGWVDAGAHCP